VCPIDTVCQAVGSVPVVLPAGDGDTLVAVQIVQ
jgi:hypothetical protein